MKSNFNFLETFLSVFYCFGIQCYDSLTSYKQSGVLLCISDTSIIKNWKETNWNVLNRWNNFHNTKHYVSQKCVHFNLFYKCWIFYIPNANPALSPAVWSRPWFTVKSEGSCIFLFYKYYCKKTFSSKYCFHQLAKDTLDSHWVKSWNTPEPRDKIGKPIFSQRTSQALGWRAIISLHSYIPRPGNL